MEGLVRDINAAIAGAFDAGATEVAVLDGHGRGSNIAAGQLDPRARLDDARHLGYTRCLDEGFSGFFAVGMHATAGTENAFLDHTQNSTMWFDYFINGVRSGELAQFATAAAHFGVPPLLVTGDQAACEEARVFHGR